MHTCSIFGQTMAHCVKISKRCLSFSTVLSRKRPVYAGTLPPSKPATPFGLFVKDTFHDCEDKPDASTRMRQLSGEWKNMEENEKKVYSTQYCDLKSVYDSEMDSFMNKLDDSERKQYKRYVEKRQQYLKIRRLIKQGNYDPFPRKLSGFLVYMKEKMANTDLSNVDEDRKIKFMKASQDWKAISEEMKMNYKAQALEINKQKFLEYYRRNPDKVKENI